MSDVDGPSVPWPNHLNAATLAVNRVRFSPVKTCLVCDLASPQACDRHVAEAVVNRLQSDGWILVWRNPNE